MVKHVQKRNYTKLVKLPKLVKLAKQTKVAKIIYIIKLKNTMRIQLKDKWTEKKKIITIFGLTK